VYSLLIKVGYRYIWFIISLLFDFFYGFLYYAGEWTEGVNDISLKVPKQILLAVKGVVALK